MLASMVPVLSTPIPGVHLGPPTQSSSAASRPRRGRRHPPVSLDLGVARHFNGFFFEGFTASSSDVEGRLAAGGSVSINNYSIASRLSQAPREPRWWWTATSPPQGRVYAGDIVVGGSAAGLGSA